MVAQIPWFLVESEGGLPGSLVSEKPLDVLIHGWTISYIANRVSRRSAETSAPGRDCYSSDAEKVSQAFISPLSNPALNQCIRCAEVP